MTESTDRRISTMNDDLALPRKNGELVFEAPWQARAFGLAVALNEQGTYPWSDFSAELTREIASAEEANEPSTYYQRWLATLENLVIARGLITRTEFEAMIRQEALHDDHDHHDHDHHDLDHHDHDHDQHSSDQSPGI